MAVLYTPSRGVYPRSPADNAPSVGIANADSFANFDKGHSSGMHCSYFGYFVFGKPWPDWALHFLPVVDLGFLLTALATRSTPRMQNQGVAIVVWVAFWAMCLFAIFTGAASEVIGVRNDLKMVRIDTVSIPAQMVGRQEVGGLAFWKWTDQLSIDPAVGEDFLFSVPTSPVSVPVDFSKPQPTWFGERNNERADLIDFFPKRLEAVASILAAGHWKITPSGAWERAATNSAAPSILRKVV